MVPVHERMALGLGRSKPFPLTSPSSRPKNTFSRTTTFDVENLLTYPGLSRKKPVSDNIFGNGHPRDSYTTASATTIMGLDQKGVAA